MTGCFLFVFGSAFLESLFGFLHNGVKAVFAGEPFDANQFSER